MISQVSLKPTPMGYISIAYLVIGILLGLLVPVSIVGSCLITLGIASVMALPTILTKLSVNDLDFAEIWILPIFLGSWLLALVARGLFV